MDKNDKKPDDQTDKENGLKPATPESEPKPGASESEPTPDASKSNPPAPEVKFVEVVCIVDNVHTSTCKLLRNERTLLAEAEAEFLAEKRLVKII